MPHSNGTPTTGTAGDPVGFRALAAGVTTFVTASFEEPPYAMERALAGLESWPIKVGMQAGARAIDDGHLDALVDAGAVGFRIHEDNGACPDLLGLVREPSILCSSTTPTLPYGYQRSPTV